jgi:hypothetical protein
MQIRKEKSGGNRILTVVLSVAAGILIILGILTALVLSTPHANQINKPVAPSGELMKKVLTGAISGQECSLTEDEVNGFIGQKYVPGSLPTIHGAVIRRVILSFREDNTADVFLPLEYQSRVYDVSANLTPSYSGGQLVMRVNSVDIGRLPVNPAWAVPMLMEAMPSAFTVNGTDIG